MRTADQIKLGLTVCAVGFLVWGMRTDNEMARWGAIVCLGAAVLIRFIAPRRPLN